MRSLKSVGCVMMVFPLSKQYRIGCNNHPDLEKHK